MLSDTWQQNECLAQRARTAQLSGVDHLGGGFDTTDADDVIGRIRAQSARTLEQRHPVQHDHRVGACIAAEEHWVLAEEIAQTGGHIADVEGCLVIEEHALGAKLRRVLHHQHEAVHEVVIEGARGRTQHRAWAEWCGRRHAAGPRLFFTHHDRCSRVPLHRRHAHRRRKSHRHGGHEEHRHGELRKHVVGLTLRP